MSAVAKASARGHAMRPSKRTLAPGVERWDCARCGAAAIEYQGNQYGAALELDCRGMAA